MTELFDIQHAHVETRGRETVLHFDNAGASLIPQPWHICRWFFKTKTIEKITTTDQSH